MIPERYQGLTLDGWQWSPNGTGEPDPRELLRGWIRRQDRPWCVVLLGTAGTGKTHLATATFSEWTRHPGCHGWWLDAIEALSLLRAEVHEMPERRTPVEKKLLDPRLLLIDDFGCTRLTDFAHEKWMRTFSHRYNHLYPTIVTTNAERLDAFDALDPRITSRMHEGLVITLKGRDKRATA